MPGGDRTGPYGQGPRTGRGLGPCGTPGNSLPLNRQKLNWRQRFLPRIANRFGMGRRGNAGRAGGGNR
jgi:hypothetical protein